MKILIFVLLQFSPHKWKRTNERKDLHVCKRPFPFIEFQTSITKSWLHLQELKEYTSVFIYFTWVGCHRFESHYCYMKKTRFYRRKQYSSEQLRKSTAAHWTRVRPNWNDNLLQSKRHIYCMNNAITKLFCIDLMSICRLFCLDLAWFWLSNNRRKLDENVQRALVSKNIVHIFTYIFSGSIIPLYLSFGRVFL